MSRVLYFGFCDRVFAGPSGFAFSRRLTFSLLASRRGRTSLVGLGASSWSCRTALRSGQRGPRHRTHTQESQRTKRKNGTRNTETLRRCSLRAAVTGCFILLNRFFTYTKRGDAIARRYCVLSTVPSKAQSSIQLRTSKR